MVKVMKNKEYALIVAGGKGTRMNQAIAKQFIEIDGLPILMHTINAFYAYAAAIEVILVLPASDFDTWAALCEKYQYKRPVRLQRGGDSRFQSVRNGLALIEGNGYVAIHDGVRPFVSPAIIDASFKIAEEKMSAVASVSLKESIRAVENGTSQALDRGLFKLIQTPQTFEVSLIKEAYTLPEDARLTDDASVAERAGHTITLFEGSYENIKVTTPEDLIVGEAFLKAYKTARPA
jgi:2-C-methyl-D-erythritol 4-phosphate cytidylyltransferase